MKNYLLKGTSVLFLSVLISLASNSCKKDSDTPQDTPVNWSFSETSTYEITPGAVVSDPVSGYDFAFGDETAVSTLKVSKIVSGAEAPFEGNGYKIEYTGNEVLYVRIKCTAGNRVLGMMYAYPDGMLNGVLTENWIGMPDMGANYDSTEYYFSIPQPYDLAPLKTGGKKRGTDLFWFSEIAKASTQSEKTLAIGLQSKTFLHDYYIAALSPALKITAMNAYEAKLPTYAYGNENYYQAFWRPLGLLGGYIFHPTINFIFNANEPTANDIAHETAHYFINLIVGNEVQKTLSGQAGFFDNHGFNEIVGRDKIVEELAYFAETAAGYKINELSEPANSFGGNSRTSVDYPGIEGFGATMLYSLVRPGATIRDVNNKARMINFPVIGLSHAQVFDIIAQGATTNNELRAGIQNYLAQYGTVSQLARFPVALQRIGWSYSVKGRLVNSSTSEPLSGYTVENILIGEGETDYTNGQDPGTNMTLADGSFKLSGSVFPGSSILRFSKDDQSADVMINCPYETPTSTLIDLSDVLFEEGIPDVFYIGQKWGGGVVFYIDETEKHGLIAAFDDQSFSAMWGCSGSSVGATSEAIGSGQDNTTAIVNGCKEAGIAARICDDLLLSGYDDWFLPSKMELYQMFLNRNVIGNFAAEADYWSSTETLADRASLEIFSTGDVCSCPKDYPERVRAIRAF